MSKTEMRRLLKGAMEQAGSAWIFRFWRDETEKNLAKIAAGLVEFIITYQRRFGDRPDPLALLSANPIKGSAFFQIDTLMLSVEMKIMVWRILMGCEIAKLEFHYEAGQEPRLSVSLTPPYGRSIETYHGQAAGDFRAIRHLGIMGGSERLILDGYYAAKSC
jgi:hypothetical protein